MKTLVHIFFTMTVMCCFMDAAMAQSWRWGIRGGSSDDMHDAGALDENVIDMAMDQANNVYVLSIVGETSLSVDGHSRSAHGGAGNIMISSFKCDGSYRWAKVLSCGETSYFGAFYGSNTYGTAIKTDTLGGVYITGSIALWGLAPNGYIDSDSTFNHSTWQSVFLLKYDTGGVYQWWRMPEPDTISSASFFKSGAIDMDVDGGGNISMLCYLIPGAYAGGSYVVDSAGAYMLKYNATGTCTGGFHTDITGTSFSSIKMTRDHKNGRYYMAGNLSGSGGSLAFGGTAVTHASFISSFSSSGTFLWVKQDSGENIAILARPVIDNLERIYFSGATADSDTMCGLSITGASDTGVPFAMAIDSNGSGFWVTYGATIFEGSGGYAIAVNNDQVAIAGDYVGTLSWPGLTSSLTTSSEYDIFITTLNKATGAATGVNRVASDAGEDEFSSSIVADTTGNFYVGGDFPSAMYTGPDTLYSVGGETDFFVAKYGYDNCGCATIPAASYTIAGTGTVSFTYTGTSGYDSVQWSFGDGSGASAANPTHTYIVSNIYDACVTVYTACGGDTYCQAVSGCLGTPTASYTSTGAGTGAFTYTGTALYDSLRWNFGDGSTSSSVNPIHTYTSSGTFSACVTVYTACGNDTFCNTITGCTVPVAAFTSAGTDTVTFTYTGTTGYDSLSWNFGDGYMATGATAFHVYSASATYTSCVTAYSACGNDVVCNTLVIDCTPSASFASSGTGTVNFTYTGDTHGLDSVVWHYGDGTNGTGTASTHSYSASGTYTVCVIAYAMCGNDTSCNSITIDCNPTAAFTFSGSPDVNFTYTGSTAGLDSVVWNYGDGSGGTGIAPTHTYTASGTYTICATAYAECGSSTICHIITINCLSAPVAETVEIIGTNPYTFGYIGTIVGYDSIIYSFGDGTYGSGFTANHTYGASGTYTVCATIYTDCGSDSACVTVSVIGVGVPQLGTFEIHVFPNPVTDELSVIGIQSDMNYRLLDAVGREVQRGKLYNGSNLIRIANCAPGLYLLQLYDSQGNRNIFRIIKQ